MTTYRSNSQQAVRRVALITFLLGIILAGVLNALEARYPIKPDFIALEVIAGVLCVGLPVIITRRLLRIEDASTYERMVVVGFICAGIPICIWQAALALV